MTLGYKTIIEIDNKKLTKEYIASLNREERESLAIAMFNYFRELGFRYPDLEIESFHKEYGNLKNYCFDVDNNEIYNNSSLATNICQYFCVQLYILHVCRYYGLLQIISEKIKFKS